MTDTIRYIEKTDDKIVEDMAVGAASSETTPEIVLDKTKNKITLAYHINTTLGSPLAEFQLYLGTNVNGNDVWVTVDSSTDADGLFTWEDPARRCRLKISEQDGTDGLDGISVWMYSTPI